MFLNVFLLYIIGRNTFRKMNFDITNATGRKNMNGIRRVRAKI